MQVARAAALLFVLALGVFLAVACATWACLQVLSYKSSGPHWLTLSFLVIAVAMGLVAVVLGRWLFSPVPEPDGITLDRSDAASLYRRVDRVARRFGATRIDSIRITGDMNAAIVQRPRWGYVGRMQTCLVLGLPLAHSVSERQFKAILAHECAHLALQRRGANAWGHHLRSWAFRALDHLVECLPFLPESLVRRFDTFVIDGARLSRLEEYEADRAAARLVGGRVLAQTLVELTLRERFLNEDFMCRVMAQMGSCRKPTIRPYREMGLGMAAGFRWPEMHEDHLGVSSLTTWEDASPGLHPPLASRLWALRVRRVRASSFAQSAAESHLSHLLPALASSFDQAWWRDVRRFWRTHYRRARQDRSARGS